MGLCAPALLLQRLKIILHFLQGEVVWVWLAVETASRVEEGFFFVEQEDAEAPELSVKLVEGPHREARSDDGPGPECTRVRRRQLEDRVVPHRAEEAREVDGERILGGGELDALEAVRAVGAGARALSLHDRWLVIVAVEEDALRHRT